MIRTILVPLDGSPLAEQAIPYAETIARAADAQVVLTRAVPSRGWWAMGGDERVAKRFAEAEEYLAGVATTLHTPSAPLTATYAGTPRQAILDEVRIRHADLVVMATHDRTGLVRLVRGSVAADVLAGCPVPVLLVQPAAAEAKATRGPGETSVLVPLDGTRFSEAALPVASEIAGLLSARLRLVTAMPGPTEVLRDDAGFVVATIDQVADDELRHGYQYLDTAWKRAARERQPAPDLSVPLGAPAESIVTEAQEQEPALIVMATHARRGIDRWRRGSTTEAVLHRAGRPLVVGPPSLAGAQSA